MSISIHLVRTTASAAAVGLVATGLVAVVGATSAGAAGQSPTSKPHARATAFALKTSGYGTRIKGGDIPAQSGTTGYQVIGCTNNAGKVRTNHQAEVTLPGLGTVSGVATRVWTSQKNGATSAWSRHTVGKVTLSDSPLGTLLIDAVTTTARAFHDAKGFHTATGTRIGGLKFQPAVGPAQSLPIPAPGNPVTIPGFATVTLGHSNDHSGKSSAVAFANGLKVELIATNSTVRVAHTQARISEGIISGVFSGSSAGLSGNLGDETVDLGRNPLSVMPCQGTGGKVQTKKLAGVDPDSNLVLGALQNSQKGKQTGRRAWGYERSSVARLNLGDGALIVNAIVAKASVKRHVRSVSTSSSGTSIGSITANGEPQTFPDTGILEIPGVARLEPGVVHESRSGISVIGLRITLLDGTGAVINLATAKLKIQKSHR